MRIPATVSDMEVEGSAKALDTLRAVPASEFLDWKPDHIIRISDPGKSSKQTGDRVSSDRGRSDGPLLKKEEMDYLESVAVHPFLGVSDRDQTLGLSAWKGHRTRNYLGDQALLTILAMNPGGRGRRFQLLELTRKGIELLESIGVKIPKGRGRGGLEHQWWCHTVSEWLNEMGATSLIEDESTGARVDVAAENGRGETIAIEVEISPGHEIENIRKDLEAGFDRVVSLVKGKPSIQKVNARLRETLGATKCSLVQVGGLNEYAKILHPFFCLGDG